MRLTLTTDDGEVIANWQVEEEIGDSTCSNAQAHFWSQLQQAIGKGEISQAEAKERVEIKRKLRKQGIDGVNFMTTEQLKALAKSVGAI
jgi:hypothetical protein